VGSKGLTTIIHHRYAIVLPYSNHRLQDTPLEMEKNPHRRALENSFDVKSVRGFSQPTTCSLEVINLRKSP